MNSNLPDPRIELFDQPGEQKVRIEPTSKMPNASLFLINKEDHTIGNLLRMKLLEDKQVLFAGYKVPHPLKYEIEIKVQTKKDVTPKESVLLAIDLVKKDFKDLQEKFQAQLNKNKGSTWD